MTAKILNTRTALAVYIFIVSKLFVYLVIYRFGCRSLWEGCFTHWDSALYISVAQEGHTLFDCNYPNNPQWCGNAGWSPLYPLLMRLLHEISNWSIECCGVVLSAIFYFLYVEYMARLMNLEKISVNAVVSLLLCSFFPGFIYLHAVFPLSLCLFLIVAFVYYLRSKKYLSCGILAMLLSWSYASGVFLLLPIGIYFLGIQIYEKRTPWRESMMTGLPSVFGLLMLYGYDYWATNHWDAMFLVQKKYAHGFYSIITMIRERWGRLIDHILDPNGIIQLQIFFVFILVFWLLRKIFGEIKNGVMYKPELLFYVGLILAYWFLPFSMGLEISLYRGSIMLAVLLLLWNNKNVDFKVMLLLSFLIFAIPMIAYFYKDIMI
jgi:hypothetical protein